MPMYYSATTRGFYSDQFPPEPPVDAVEVPLAEWEALLEGQSAGQQIEPDVNGYPVLVPAGVSPPTPPQFSPAYIAALRAALGLPIP